MLQRWLQGMEWTIYRRNPKPSGREGTRTSTAGCHRFEVRKICLYKSWYPWVNQEEQVLWSEITFRKWRIQTKEDILAQFIELMFHSSSPGHLSPEVCSRKHVTLESRVEFHWGAWWWYSSTGQGSTPSGRGGHQYWWSQGSRWTLRFQFTSNMVSSWV